MFIFPPIFPFKNIKVGVKVMPVGGSWNKNEQDLFNQLFFLHLFNRTHSSYVLFLQAFGGHQIYDLGVADVILYQKEDKG